MLIPSIKHLHGKSLTTASTQSPFYRALFLKHICPCYSSTLKPSLAISRRIISVSCLLNKAYGISSPPLQTELQPLPPASIASPAPEESQLSQLLSVPVPSARWGHSCLESFLPCRLNDWESQWISREWPYSENQHHIEKTPIQEINGVLLSLSLRV